MLFVDSVDKYYGNKHVLKKASLQISEGICYGVVGPNGAGKSTLIKIIASIIQDYKGNVQFTEEKLRIGYVPQEIALEETVTAQENLIFFGKLYGLRGDLLRNRVKEVLSEIGLTERGKDKVRTFSGGMKRRINIGCAIMHNPKLIIMDEPTVGIDPQSRRYIFQMIEQFKIEGRTIIYASHYMEEVEQLCDEAAFIDRGQIIESGPIDMLINRHAVPAIFVKGLNSLPDNMEGLGSVKNKDGGKLVTTNHPLQAMEIILQHCKKTNVELERLELVKPRLEDIFFSLTGNQLRD
ncbi:ABC transporter ATP-binding protein [Paucisalibacillus globulus]|uniref:ABC transporter ATP-binding protein n=1 Tax=Paucisalibacillus globulus TaxID=351095 RepID=UPI000403E703